MTPSDPLFRRRPLPGGFGVVALFLSAAVLFWNASASAEMSPEQWEGLRTLIRSHVEERRAWEAIQIATTALSAVEPEMGSEHPRTVYLLSELTALYWEIGDSSAAKRCARRLKKLKRKPYDAYMALGAHYRRLDDFKAAESMYQNARRLEPDRTEPIVELAQIYGRSGQGEKAVELLQKAVLDNPADYWLSLQLAETHISLGRIREAGELLERLRREHPEDTGLLINLGYFHLNHGNTDAAEAVFRELRGMDKARGYHHLAQYFRDTGRFNEAVSYFERALEMADPAFHDDSPRLHTMNHLASLYLQLGKREDAERLAERALSTELGWRNDLPWVGLASFSGKVYLELDRPEAAQRVYQAFLERAEQEKAPPQIHAFLLTRLGETALRRGRTSEARSRLLKAASLWEISPVRPGDTPLTELASLLRKVNEPTKAEVLLKRLIAAGSPYSDFGNNIFPFVDAYLALADLYLSQERFAEAEDHYRRVLALMETYPVLQDTKRDVLLRLAELLDRQGRAQEAEEVRAKIESHMPRPQK